MILPLPFAISIDSFHKTSSQLNPIDWKHGTPINFLSFNHQTQLTLLSIATQNGIFTMINDIHPNVIHILFAIFCHHWHTYSSAVQKWMSWWRKVESDVKMMMMMICRITKSIKIFLWNFIRSFCYVIWQREELFICKTWGNVIRVGCHYIIPFILCRLLRYFSRIHIRSYNYCYFIHSFIHSYIQCPMDVKRSSRKSSS